MTKPSTVVVKEYADMDYFPIVEKLADILSAKTQSSDPLFFRILVSYYLTKVASMMRCNIKTIDRGDIPVSIYAINLALSGHGKGHSTNIVEERIINEFRERFLESTFPIVAERNLAVIANSRYIKKNSDPDSELELVTKEFDQLGTLAFSFDSGTTAAVKQMRHKLLMANAGSMNMEIDEIGSNLLGQQDVLTTFLELFDVGKVKQKLIKNTSENTRNEEIDGRTPTNMMLFGTPAKLLDGGKIEDEFTSMLETGYARRCLFGYATISSKSQYRTPEEIYDMLTDNSSEAYIKSLSHKLGNLADSVNFNTTLTMSRDVALLVIAYQSQCEHKAEEYSDYKEIQKAELSHRYFKCLKLAGTYAFIDGSAEITEEYFYNAMKLVEDSGESFHRILSRDKASVKLAKYIAGVRREVTHADIIDDLPFYKGSETHRREMMKLAIQWGYKNNVIIKETVEDGIPFFKGESLEETDINQMRVSYSTDIATGYRNDIIPFDRLDTLTHAPGYHWVQHHIDGGRRREENCIPGFNLVVIDVDNGTTIETAKLLLHDYQYLLYTTKRNTPDANRFRVVFPISHTLKLDPRDFREFMNNIYDWLPFDSDRQTNQRARKWLSHNGYHFFHDGEILDALLFIPKTKKAEKQKAIISDQQSLSNVERWFCNNTATGNRSNQMIKYAYMLVDSGLDIDTIQDKIIAFNSKLSEPLSSDELFSTVFITLSKKIHLRDTA